MIKPVGPKSFHAVCDVSRGGLEQEIEAIYRRYSAELLSYAETFVRREDSAIDAVQEAFLRYFVERNYGRVIENPRGWLYRVLRNYLLDRLGRAALKREVPAVDGYDVPDPGQGADAAVESAQAASEIAARFSCRELQCLRLRAGGASYEEIAASLGIQSGTVSSLLTRVHKKLRQVRGDRIHFSYDTLAGLCFLFAGAESRPAAADSSSLSQTEHKHA
ncbi:MAG TPA: sigma-70 family RNA polymerase sigma factor [Bryobacteraceae bacterium]|nr:sigma-70 family RNA polymerase sigma factor [Bryobacteraceae bacterium]